MQASLEYVEIENFKSYEGKVVLGPLKRFMCVVGPNGSGKSNFMDAIAFVMGENSSSLRVSRLRDLIHGASIGKPTAKCAYVTAKFLMDDSSHKIFTRTIQGSICEYKVNQMPVTLSAYLKELESIGVNVKAKNFIVFQGTVEAIAMKSPKERTALFEEISRSAELREDYERLKSEMLKAEKDMLLAHKNKNMILSSKREVLMEKDNAKIYKELKDTLDEKELQLQLFLLFYNQKDIEQHEVESQKITEKINVKRDEKKAASNTVKILKKQNENFMAGVKELEDKIQKLQEALNNVCASSHEADLKAKHSIEKKKKTLSLLEKAREAHRAQEDDIKALKEKLKATEEKYEKQVHTESQSQGQEIHLEETQLKEYHELRKKESRLTSSLAQSLQLLDREQGSDQDNLDYGLQKKSELDAQQYYLKLERDNLKKRRERVTNHIRAMTEQVAQHKELKSKVQHSKDELKALQDELLEVQEHIFEKKAEDLQKKHREKKREVLETLKTEFPGVIDRLVNLCGPIHEKYEEAVAKVVGKHLDAVVVRDERTAHRCISFLKKHLLGHETFLPLTKLKAKQIEEHMRNISDPPNVHLLIDVIQFHPEIERIVLFATNGTLVCETSDDAHTVAYEIMENRRLNVISLDGTYFQKTGIISGALPETARTLQHQSNIAQLKAKKEKLSEKISSLSNLIRQEFELEPTESYIKGLETELYCLSTNLGNIDKELKDLDEKSENLIRQQKRLESHIKKIREVMETRENQMKKLKEDLEATEDSVFKDFCQQIGIKNIRMYEGHGLRYIQDRSKQYLELEQEKNQVQNQLDYNIKISCDMNDKILRLERALLDHQNDIQFHKKTYEEREQEKERLLVKLNKYRADLTNKVEQVDLHEAEMKEAEEKIKKVAKDIQTSEKELLLVKQKIEQLKVKRHHLLDQSKMGIIHVPVTNPSPSESGSSKSTPENDEKSSTEDSQQIYSKEHRVIIDFAALEARYQNCHNQGEITAMEDELRAAVDHMKRKLAPIRCPNFKAEEKLDILQDQLVDASKEFQNLRVVARKAKLNFEKVKKKRYDRFMRCLDAVGNEINGIYKHLTQSTSGIALLTAENAEEPYLEGTTYCCIVPGKTCQPMQNLSGGERTLAAVALLMAMQSFQPSPFFVLDEIDAALDNKNIRKLANYFCERSSSLQTIVISLKDQFFCHADALIGIYPNVNKGLASKVVTMDLTKYPVN